MYIIYVMYERSRTHRDFGGSRYKNAYKCPKSSVKEDNTLVIFLFVLTETKR